MAEDDDPAAKDSHSTRIQKQKDSLAKAKTVLHRPDEQNNSRRSVSLAPPITYPEFAPAQQGTAPRLVTFRRLLLVLYLSIGAAATSYIVSKLYLQPLLMRLVNARKDLNRHALNKATQLRDQLSTYSNSTRTIIPEDMHSPEANVSQNLKRIAETLGMQSNPSEAAAHNELSFATEDLLVYLNGHIYASASFAGYGSGFAHGSDDKSRNDLVNLVKSEIRSVKGAVLNIRNFPAPDLGLK